MIQLDVNSTGELRAEGKRLDIADLREKLQLWESMHPIPHVVLMPSPKAPCETVRSVRRIMEAAPICRGPYSHCGEGNWKDWRLTM
ncbi:MAG TPA: hypothetical protein VF582_04970 [Allosphingosinicella sp.]